MAEKMSMGCARCRRKVYWDHTGDFTGHPYGWYRLSQRAPLTQTRGGIRTIGWFCGLECLGHAVLEQEQDWVNQQFEAE